MTTLVVLPGGPGLGLGAWKSAVSRIARDVVVVTSRDAAGRDPFVVQRRRALRAVERAGSDVVLCAHSAGCYAAVQVREAVPHALRAVVLLAGQATDCVDDPHLLERRLAAAPPELATIARESAAVDPVLALGDDRMRAYLAADLLLTEPACDERTREVVDELCAHWDLGSLRTVLSGQASTPDLTARGWSVDVPTLVVNGGADPWAGPVSGRRLAAVLPGAVAEVVPDAGHLVWLGDDVTEAWLVDLVASSGVAS